MHRFTSFLSGAITGALVGSALALLLAPASGEELKSRARERISGLRREIEAGYQTRMSELEAELERLRGKPGD
jgi:gas vesicle protein